MIMDCISFLKWALPELNMRWDGFRKVRKQVCKRIKVRIRDLGLNGYMGYQKFLNDHPGEWEHLDKLCVVTISKFYRDRKVFDRLRTDFIPEKSCKANADGRKLKIWSIGCASGEEPYTLSLIWHLEKNSKVRRAGLEILATELLDYMLKRAEKGCYRESSLKELPTEWKERAFHKKNCKFCLFENYKCTVMFKEHDIRNDFTWKGFDIILCRNLVGFYYKKSLQTKIFNRLYKVLNNEGILVLGGHEEIPERVSGFNQIDKGKCFYRKTG